MKRYFIYFLLYSLLFSEPYEGLTLITTNNNPVVNSTILIDNNFNIINTWIHDTAPSSIAYLMPDSSLYVPCRTYNPENRLPTGGRFKKMDWDGNLLWDYTLPNNICIPHHDIEVLPNGNILAICMETKSNQDVLVSGKENLTGSMTLDMIIEIKPEPNNQASIVWKWHFWDRLIQDVNPELSNFNNISNNPGKLDINCTIPNSAYGNSDNIEDWNHCNAISYNKYLDQIILSSRFMHEIYIIDHSTTTEEAATSFGGQYNLGGDFLYRWGNPQIYKRGDNSNKILNAPHGVNWVPRGYPGEGNIVLFNNKHSSNNSSIIEISPPINSYGTYNINIQDAFGPNQLYWFYESNFFSGSQSGVFKLPNGNYIITSTEQSRIFEVNLSGNTEWEYNESLAPPRAIKYPADYLNIILGDFNNDEIVNIQDTILLVSAVIGNNDIINSHYDLNNDEVINVLDIILLVNIILS